MAASAASSEHFEKLHEIFRGLLEDLQGVPERLLGTAGTVGRDGGRTTICTPDFP
uniref:Vesicle transport through interaction with t-SNAREs 1B n=1 Tax=Mus musculus TaxID=10090 RepID=E0CYE5_MOUSE